MLSDPAVHTRTPADHDLVRLSRLCGFFCLVWSLALAQAPAQQLEISVGRQRHLMEAQRRNDHTYYRLSDLAEVLGLRLQEHGGLLVVEGAGGSVRLVDGRPLVRSEDGYILLSAPVWRKDRDDWSITEDFLTKALPLIVERKLNRVSDRRYRLEVKEENRVIVRVANHADHVRIVFQPSRTASIRVRDFDSYIAIEFGQYLVRPETVSADSPDPRFVSSLEFDTSHAYGRFRIHKGTSYGSFRQFRLRGPNRNVVDVYGATTPAPRPEVALVPPPPSPDSSRRLARPDVRSRGPVSEEREFRDVITIDPGHGGEDYGVISEEGDLEKTLALSIANRIEGRISANGYRGMLTRTRDVELGIEQRSSVGNYYRSRVYVSLHLAGSVSPGPGGPVVYVHKHVEPPDEGADTSVRTPAEDTNVPTLLPWEAGQKDYRARSRKLAEQLQNDLNFLWGTDNRVIEAPLAVLAPIHAPAILIEMGFLSNPEDLERLRLPEFQERLSQAVAFRVLRFLQTSEAARVNSDMDLR